MTAHGVISNCRRFPSENKCSLTITGTEDEAMKVAVRHAVEDHGEKDSPEIREQIRGAHATKEVRASPNGIWN